MHRSLPACADLRAQVQKLWDNGRLLADLLREDRLFPLRLTLKGPSSADLSERFDAVRTWIGKLQEGRRHGDRVAWREVRHRIIGSNALPETVWIDTLENALDLIGKDREAERFQGMAPRRAATTPIAGLTNGRSRPWNLPRTGRTCWTWLPGCRSTRAPLSTCGKWTFPACTANSSKRIAACSPNSSISP